MLLGTLTFPSSSTKILSESMTVWRRWAIVNTVQAENCSRIVD